MIGVGVRGPLPLDDRTEADPRRGSPPDDERDAWIALAAVPGIGQVSFSAIVARAGTAAAAADADVRELLALVPRADEATELGLRRLQRDGIAATAGELHDAVRRVGGTIVTRLDPDYPAALAALHAAPPVLYVLGSPRSLARRALAVVGTRRPTGYGRAVTAELADEVARAGLSIVSGLALGIDGIAHEAALDAGGCTVAVLPSPIDRVYPPRHRNLAARIVAAAGAIVSEAPPGRTAGRPDFARRNRIISGLAEAVVVVEAPDRSGALLTAAAAMAQGRDLYAVPGPIDSVTSRGTNRLIADHQAELVTSPMTLVHALGAVRFSHAGKGAGTGGKDVDVAALTEPEGLVLMALLRRSGSIEELSSSTHLSTPALASAITLLEARGLVTSYGGVTFHPTLAARRIGRDG